MGTIARVLGTAVVVVGGALATASPSSADQTMEGFYTFNTPGQPTAEWTIYPICVPTVGDLREPLELPVACTLKLGRRRTTHRRTVGAHHEQGRGLPVSGRQHRTHRRHLQVRRRDAHGDTHISAQRGVRRPSRDDQIGVHAHVRQAVADSRRQVPAGVRAGRQSPLQVSPARR